MKDEISKDTAEALFEENSLFVFRLAFFLTKSKELADDIVQETFLQVFRKYHTFEPTRPIHPWIYKITLNTTRNLLRKQKWLKYLDVVPENQYPGIIENTILKYEEEKELWSEVNNLSFKSKEVIILHFYYGMKLKEVSNTLCIPLGTCKSRLNSALNMLRKKFPENEFYFLSKGEDLYDTVKYTP